MRKREFTRALPLVFLCLILNSVANSASEHTANSQLNSQLNAQKIAVSDPELARKIAISYHHAILEVNYNDGYIIADLSSHEKSQLGKLGLSIQPATEWQKRFNSFQKELKVKQLKAKTIQRNGYKSKPGIPGFECYATVEETLQQGAQLASDNPTLAQWIDIGNSWKKANGQGGFDLMVLKITNESITGNKPILFIQSSMHAREFTPAALNLDFAKYLLSEYQTNADIQWIIDHREIHLLFQMNPDGRKIAEERVLQRKNTNNNHCPNGELGVDLNRNFGFFWNTTPGGSSGDACQSTYRGPFAESEPETQAVANYIRSLYPDRRGPNDNDAAPSDTSGVHLDIHSFSQLVLWPYGHTSRPSPNDASYVELGNKLAWFNQYTPVQSVGLYPTDGTSDNISYGELGVAALAFELGTDFFQSCTVYERRVKPDNLPALIYSAKVAVAPYQLAFGPEITRISLNGSDNGVSANQGSMLDLSVTADARRTQLPTAGRQVSKIEYSIDHPFNSPSATIVELTEHDGEVDSGNETMHGQISTAGLSAGRHLLYTRGFNKNGQPGVASAVFIDIGENNSPVPEFTFSCEAFQCSFDASSSIDTDGAIIEFSWSFGDGNSANGELVNHTFQNNGAFNVELSVTDNSGTITKTTQSVQINEAGAASNGSSSSSSGSLFWLLIGCIGIFSLRELKYSRTSRK